MFSYALLLWVFFFLILFFHNDLRKLIILSSQSRKNCSFFPISAAADWKETNISEFSDANGIFSWLRALWNCPYLSQQKYAT